MSGRQPLISPGSQRIGVSKDRKRLAKILLLLILNLYLQIYCYHIF